MKKGMKRKPYKELSESSKQHLNSIIVDREVWCCVSSETEYIIKQSFDSSETPFSYDDIDNTTTISREEAIKTVKEDYTEKEIKEALDYIDEPTDTPLQDLDEDELRSFLDFIGDDIENYSDENEVLEWWKVSDWLLNKLSLAGEPTIKDFNLWGRTTSGQSIKIDGQIYEITGQVWDEGFFFDDTKLDENQFYEAVKE